ncbi:Hypothetical protein R9X50_00801400 [Acrodontium crateriforme]|uniref:Protein BTN n=1 Tax=Acrodontium crateriforme TaxID=150365 RepID=A0AAQ3REE6_9PEZI|nr:Hypothetical protein R9X50_00801400 [Acrodontium crateriforme]
MLPMPGTPASSWAVYKARLSGIFEGADARVCIAFWLFGLINNIFYVIILSAALDLVGPSIPKATVLLASIIPGLATKLVVPYFIDLIPYSSRIFIFAALSTCGMLIVALSPSRDAGSVAAKVAGIILANISSGAGEVNFLSLTHFYGPFSLASWGSGTGGAGLIGASGYALATTKLGFSVQHTLLASAVIPLIMLISFFMLLPLGPLRAASLSNTAYQSVQHIDDDEPYDREAESLLAQHTSSPQNASFIQRTIHDLQTKLVRARTLVVPYMVPLFLVYAAEYTINQGVTPTLLFPLENTPFTHFRDFYPTYGAIYQLGVFISRSSLPFIRIRSLYVPSVLQVANLIVLTIHALWPFIPTVWFVFAVVFWEGLLGGLVYVSTFAAIREEVPENEREFSLGATTVSDSGGICLAGVLGVIMESALCSWQVNHGIQRCRQL